MFPHIIAWLSCSQFCWLLRLLSAFAYEEPEAVVIPSNYLPVATAGKLLVRKDSSRAPSPRSLVFAPQPSWLPACTRESRSSPSSSCFIQACFAKQPQMSPAANGQWFLSTEVWKSLLFLYFCRYLRFIYF